MDSEQKPFDFSAALDRILSSGVLNDYPEPRPAKKDRLPGICPIRHAGHRIAGVLADWINRLGREAQPVINANRESFEEALKAYLPLDLLLKYTEHFLKQDIKKNPTITKIIDNSKPGPHSAYAAIIDVKCPHSPKRIGEKDRRASGRESSGFVSSSETDSIEKFIKDNPLITMSLIIFQAAAIEYIEGVLEKAKDLEVKDKTRIGEVYFSIRQNFDRPDFYKLLLPAIAFGMDKEKSAILTAETFTKGIAALASYGTFDRERHQGTPDSTLSTCPAKSLFIKLFGLRHDKEGPTLFSVHEGLKAQNLEHSRISRKLRATLEGRHL